MTTTPATDQDVEVVIKKRHAFSSVADAFLEDRRLSLAARGAGAWMLGRPPGWRLMLGHMKYTLGMSDKQWTGIRKELTAAGYYSQKKERGVSATGKQGVWKWTHIVTDDPLFSPSTLSACMENSTHAGSSDAASTHAGSSDARGGDIPDVHNTSVNTVVNREEIQQDKNQTNQNPHQTLEPQAQGFGGTNGGGDPAWQDLTREEQARQHLEAAVWQQAQRGKPVSNMGGFAATLKKRWDSSGFSPQDFDTLHAFRAAKKKIAASPDGHTGFQKVDYMMGQEKNTMTMAEGVALMRKRRAERAAGGGS